jgi:hypothetical protein
MTQSQKNKKTLKFLFLVAFMFNGFYSFGQSNITTSQIWLDYNPSYNFNNKFEYFGNAGYRTNSNSLSWNQIYLKPAVRYNLKNNFHLEGGLGFYYVFGQTFSDRFEIRPWQSIRLKWPEFDFVAFKNIIKIEERFSYLTYNWKSSFSLRLRYKLESQIKFKNSMILKRFNIPMYVEFFIPINNDVDEIFSNRHRFGIGVSHKTKGYYEVTFYYNWEKSRISVDDQFDIATNAFQLKLKKTFK